jgi:hypothetical protein
MKLTCNTIGDMLPLVVEDLASEDTIKLVKDHIKDCPKCRVEYEELATPRLDFSKREDLDTIPLKNVKKKLKNRNLYTGILTAFIISLILFIGFDKVTKPIAISYGKAVESIEKQDDLVYINFNEDVIDYEIVNYHGNEYELMAWKTYFGNLFKNGKNKSVVVNANGEKVDRIYYISQGQEIDKIIYGSPETEDGGKLTLPRLAMNYYLLIAGGIFTLFLLATTIFQKKERITKITLPIMLISVSYILAHIVILGLNGTTHHILRDLFFVLITALLFFIILILLVYKDNIIKVKE